MATGRVRPGWNPPSSGDSGAFTFGVDVTADGNQAVSGIWWFQPAAPGTITDVTVGLFVQATQTLVAPTAVGTLLAANVTAGAWNFVPFGATATMAAGVVHTMVARIGGEHAYEDPAGYTIDDPSNTVHLTLGRFEAGTVSYPDDGTWTGQHGLDIEMVEDTISATLTIVLPEPDIDLSGEAVASASLTVTLPEIDIELDAEATVSGVLDLVVPEVDISLSVPGSSGGGPAVPCSWNIPDPLCCESWETLSPAQQAAAHDYASTVLWAATGRQFGLCQITVRPCGMKRCQDGGAEFFGYDWSGGTWVPYIFNGVWFNCGCAGMCCCDPRCQVRLMGPVDSIVEVSIGGVVIPPSSYRVDDEHWLVRTDGECWPQCSDMNSDDGDEVFLVTYLRGTAVPAALLNAAATLACEWGKACAGGDCRLGNRVTSMARNGVQINMVDPSELLADGLTGITEVDALIAVYNPYGLKQRIRIYAPELRVPRTVTSA